MSFPRLSVDDYDRDRRITALERQVLVLSGQVASRDAALVQLLRESAALAADAVTSFTEQYPQMLAEIDTKVLSAITDADAARTES